MVNKVILVGNVGKDPEIKSAGGKEIAVFSIATSKRYKKQGDTEKTEKTTWHRIVVFQEGLVGVVKQYVKKGSKLYVEGELAINEWTDKDGIERRAPEVHLGFGSAMVLCDKRDGHNDANTPPDTSYGEEID